MLGSFPSVLVGLVLVLATLAVGGDSLRVAIKETRRELKMRRKREGGQPMVAASLEPEQHSMLAVKQAGPEGDGVDAHKARSPPQDEKVEDELVEQSASGSGSSAWSWRLFDSTLCVNDGSLDRSNAARQDDDPGLAAKVKELTAQLNIKDREFAAQLDAKDKEFAAQLGTKDRELGMKDKELMVRDGEIARLERLLDT